MNGAWLGAQGRDKSRHERTRKCRWNSSHITEDIWIDELSLVVALQLLAANLALAGMSRALGGERRLYGWSCRVDGPHGWLVFRARTIGGRTWEWN